uniref:C-type lectin domain-containing protein n=1 Tax=Cyclopterus lumpus TaxID=8103 RepID=A0A8C3AXJ1_CYCLU
MLTVSLLVCAMMVLTRANDDGQAVTPSLAFQDQRRAVICPSRWTQYGGRCFYHETTEKSWAQAEVHMYIQGMSPEILWIGGSDCEDGGAWFWTDGKPMNYGSWCLKKPDNSQGDCCDKCWDDMPCHEPRGSICAMPPQ